MKIVGASAVAVLASSAVLFFLHKVTADNLPQWISEQMVGVEIKRPPYGLDVVVPGAVTSIEGGIALLIAYVVLRKATPTLGTFARALCLAMLCLALGGNLVRWPIMQLVGGNPLHVTLVQHAALWFPYVMACLTLAYLYEWLSQHGA